VAELHVALVSPDRALWAGEATMLIARTTDGELGVLPGHISLLGELVESPVRVKRAGESDLVATVHGGFLSVTRDNVIVLADRLEVAEEGTARSAARPAVGETL
jgi:F-type H+-transporting ATPase subunit epsilon